MQTFRTTDRTDTASRRPNLVVGWASGLVQVWPTEDTGIDAPQPLRSRIADSLGTPQAVLQVLAAVDGEDENAYARRYAADAGAVLALTHHTEVEILSASVEVRGPLSPSRVLDILHADILSEHRLLAS